VTDDDPALLADDATGPLAGVLVADFSRVLAGPYAAMTLGDLGATVIKVERPGGGDDTRAWGPPWAPNGASTYYLGLNRNKRSVQLDLGDADDRALAVRLAERTDVLVENFKPGTLERYGLGYDALAAVNRGLVYCSITGFGATDAAAELPGYDLIVQAGSGLMSITGEPDGQPIKVGVALVDHICALQATIGVLAALRHRERTGEGQRVAVSLMGAALAALLNQASGYLGAGAVPGRLGNRHPSIAPYQTFPTGDGHMVLACGNDAQFAKVASVVGAPELAGDPRFAGNTARVAHIDELEHELVARLRTRTTAAWTSAFSEVGVPAGPINDVAQAFAFADAIGLGAVAPPVPTGGVATVASPIGLSRTPPAVRRGAPALGEHDDEIRRWLRS
jgi:crotonobetainyl-CoA:carnitine CoA-transferase CaiB-like acyl-CoA transferase